jgi:hypothetical protein
MQECTTSGSLATYLAGALPTSTLCPAHSGSVVGSNWIWVGALVPGESSWGMTWMLLGLQWERVWSAP